MDLRLTQDQQMIQAMAREVLGTESPATLARAMEDDPRGYLPPLWRKLAELGWTAVAFPEDYGGTGQSFLDLCVLIEEMGRVRLPAPFFCTVVLCGLPIARFGTEAQKVGRLRSIATGDRILTYAHAEPGRPSFGAAVADVVARPEADGYVLDGMKLFVPYAHVADDLLMTARTDHGMTAFLVDARARGITYERLDTVGADHQHRVALNGVRVAGDQALGGIGGGADVVRAIDQWGAAATCAEMVGGAQRVLEIKVEYAKQRTQFGRPIGAFQAVQHHCADMAMYVDGSRLAAYEAIWRLSEGLDAGGAVSIAKAWVSDAYARVCALSHQVHGAIGFTREHDLQLYFHHARACELAFGDADYHRELVAQKLGL